MSVSYGTEQTYANKIDTKNQLNMKVTEPSCMKPKKFSSQNNVLCTVG